MRDWSKYESYLFLFFLLANDNLGPSQTLVTAISAFEDYEDKVWSKSDDFDGETVEEEDSLCVAGKNGMNVIVFYSLCLNKTKRKTYPNTVNSVILLHSTFFPRSLPGASISRCSDVASNAPRDRSPHA